MPCMILAGHQCDHTFSIYMHTRIRAQYTMLYSSTKRYSSLLDYTVSERNFILCRWSSPSLNTALAYMYLRNSRGRDFHCCLNFHNYLRNVSDGKLKVWFRGKFHALLAKAKKHFFNRSLKSIIKVLVNFCTLYTEPSKVFLAQCIFNFPGWRIPRMLLKFHILSSVLVFCFISNRV